MSLLGSQWGERMAIVKCAACGTGINTEKLNFVFTNDTFTHKNCPAKKPSVAVEELDDYNELRDAIEWAFVNKRLSDKYGLSWTIVGNQIKKLRKEGYSYKDQLYAFKYIVEQDGGYWGYGRVGKFISRAMEHKKREEVWMKEKAEKYKEWSNSNPGAVMAPNSSGKTFFDIIDDDLDL